YVNGRYTVSWRAPFTTRWSKTHSDSLASSLVFAWRKHSKGCSVDSIMQGQRVTIDNNVLAQVLDEMDNLVREYPKQSIAEVAEQVIKGIDKPEANE
ncbi:MAG: hypothetical protein LC731_03885, partial [Acidobacteria bacterium]|nr:hypothetical protein [Acidobacteriota bacterium]